MPVRAVGRAGQGRVADRREPAASCARSPAGSRKACFSDSRGWRVGRLSNRSIAGVAQRQAIVPPGGDFQDPLGPSRQGPTPISTIERIGLALTAERAPIGSRLRKIEQIRAADQAADTQRRIPLRRERCESR